MVQSKFYPAVAYGTLVVDAYLALAAVATRATPREVHRYLPPFGLVGESEASRFLVLLVATWTAILALGCLRASDEHRERPHAAAVLWFVLVLAVVWLALVLPWLVGLFWQWFLWGR
jgi:hypothetical protein